MTNALIALQSSAATGIVAGVIAVVKTKVAVKKELDGQVKERNDKMDQRLSLLCESQRHCLRSTLCQDHERFMRQGYCSVTDKDEIQKTYEIYHNLGGNGVQTKLYNDMMQLPEFIKGEEQ